MSYACCSHGGRMQHGVGRWASAPGAHCRISPLSKTHRPTPHLLRPGATILSQESFMSANRE